MLVELGSVTRKLVEVQHLLGRKIKLEEVAAATVHNDIDENGKVQDIAGYACSLYSKALFRPLGL